MTTHVETYERGEAPWAHHVRNGTEYLRHPDAATCDPVPEGLKLGGGLAHYLRTTQADVDPLDLWVTSEGEAWLGIWNPKTEELMTVRAPMAVAYLLCGFAALLGVVRVARLRLFIEDFVRQIDPKTRVRAENGSMFIEALTADDKWGRMHAQPPMQEEAAPATRQKRRFY